MNSTLVKALAGLALTGAVLAGSTLLFWRNRTFASLLQLFGAGCLLLMVLTHVCEALHLFASMGWGLEHSAGHYLDLWCAIFGLTLFPIGLLLQVLTQRERRAKI